MKLLNGSHVENNHFYIGFVYIPHENNVFYRKNELDLFSLLIEDISVYKEKGSVIVSGDFNSRIGTCPDFIENDLMGTEVNNFISNVIDYNCDIPMSTRESQDLVVNSFGRKLLDLCRSTCTRVCNGRTFGDKNGKYTFFNHLGASVNDFTIVSENDFHLVDYFCVEDFNEWSDHAPIVFHVSVNVSTVCNDAFSNTKTRFVRSKWENSLYNDVKIELCKHLEQLEQTLVNVEGTVEGVNNCIESFTQILNNVFLPFCGKEVVIDRCRNDNQSKSIRIENKPWFDDKCIQLRKIYMEKLKLFNAARTHFHRNQLVTSKREYKTYERRIKRDYLRYQGDQLEYLKKKNPKEFYRIFRKRKGNIHHGPNISEFYNHFKELSATEQITSTRTDDSEIATSEATIPSYPELSGLITTEEVTLAIKRLKKEKSPGVDNLLNEYFIEYQDYLIAHLVALFNVVFSSGFFPKIWSEGIITPVFKKGKYNDCNNYRGITLVSCLSKIFTSILNERLKNWSENYDIISDA